MSDEVDDLLRRTMTALDRQVPDGYFDTLASRTLARLGDPALDEPGDEAPSPQASRSWASDPVPATPVADQITPLPGPRARWNRRPILAVVGLGLAAAAGVMVFVSTREPTAGAPEMAMRMEQVRAPGGELAANGPATGVRPATPPIEVAASGHAPAVPEPATPATPAMTEAHAGSAAQGDQVAKPVQPAKSAVDALPRPDRKPTATKGGGKAAFTDEPTKLGASTGKDARAGGTPGELEPHRGKTKAGKASLSPGDIKRAMTAVAATVQACVTGQADRATVQLTVAPSGQVQKVTATGALAGTPAGTCVERAVAAATFPPWDGEPERFSYSYLPSD